MWNTKEAHAQDSTSSLVFLRELWKVKFCAYSPPSKECRALQLGHLVSIIGEHNLDQEDRWNGSLNTIIFALKEMVPLYYWSATGHSYHYGSGGTHHVNCSWVERVKDLGNEVQASVEGLKFSGFPSRSRTGRTN